MASKVLIVLTVLVGLTTAFPDGAPVDTCVKPRTNQPYHGQTRPQTPDTNPFRLTASATRYEPGTSVTVKIDGEIFRGFFIQARDANTNEWIGTWTKTPNTKSHAECSAITQADPREKQLATLVWTAPSNARGNVYFTGTILKDYATYWSDIVSTRA